MKNAIRKLYRTILWILPKKIAHKIFYKRIMNKKLDLKNPKDFNEKIQYMMLNTYGERETICSDKYLVREYVEKKGYKNLLTKLYKVYDKVDEIKLEELPDKFVLKTNHSSGSVIICKDKKHFDIENAKVVLSKVLKQNFSKQSLEYHYSKIKRKIICEEYIEPEDSALMPNDYKIYCFDGKAICTLVCSEREEELKLDYYDLNWKYLNYSTDEYKSYKTIEKPIKYDEMIEIAERLSEGFPYVRVDLYNVKEKIYFGELTFTPAAGVTKYNTQEALDYFGELIKI